MHDRGCMNLTKPDQIQSEELTEDAMELSHLKVLGGNNDEMKWDEDTAHSSGNSWGVWLYLGCRDFKSWLTTGRPSPLWSFKKCKQQIYFFQLWCRERSSGFRQFPPLHSILHFILLDTSLQFHPTTLRNRSRGRGSFTAESKFIPSAWLPNLSHIEAFIDWDSVSSLAEGHRALTLIRREGTPWVKPRLLLKNPISLPSKTWSLP